MELDKLAQALVIPILVMTGISQYMKTIPFLQAHKWMVGGLCMVCGVGSVWLCSDLLKIPDLTNKTIAILGIIVGLASVGLFGWGKNVTGIDKVLK